MTILVQFALFIKFICYSQAVDIIKSMSSYNPSDHLHLISRSISKFANTELTVCVVVREPFVIYNEPDNKLQKQHETKKQDNLLDTENLDNYSGVAIEVTKRLAEIFKFKVRITRPADGQFGILANDGHWTGLMGSLVRNESQLGVTALSITSSRAEVVDFTRAYYVETSALLLKIPEEIQDFFVIFEPFKPFVWFTLFLTIIFLVLVIMLMTKLEDNEKVMHNRAKLMRLRERRSHKRHSIASSLALNQFASFFMAQATPMKINHNNNNNNRNDKLSVNYLDDDDENLDSDDLIAIEMSEFGSNWTERFYYSVTCVLNILLNKGLC